MPILAPSNLCFLSLPTLSVLSILFGSYLGWTLMRLNCLSILSSYTSLIATHLKSAWDISLYRACFGHLDLGGANIPRVIHHELGLSLYRSPVRPEREGVECAICLSEIEPRSETRELKCHHLFHRVCIERWLGYNRMSCPLCRSFVTPWRAVAELGAEVLFFKFCDVSSTDREDMWWLR